jgi:hypothetical protein
MQEAILASLSATAPSVARIELANTLRSQKKILLPWDGQPSLKNAPQEPDDLPFILAILLGLPAERCHGNIPLR